MTIREKASEFYWYHCVDLGGGFITDGDYHLAPLLPKYGLPEDMRGMTALDVGRGSGFFAFEMERRGADVTALDLPSFFDWDFVGGEERRRELLTALGDPEAYTKRHITGAFEFAHAVRRSKVRSERLNVYNLSPEALGGRKFDVVFAGSLTSHLRDPILAFEKMYSVTARKCIVAAPRFDLPGGEHLALMSLVGTTDSDRRSWWTLNATGLTEMLRCARFGRVEIYSDLSISNRRVPDLHVPHLVAHAYVQGD